MRGRSGRCLPWRIIPARAGFTPQTGDADERPWDHPRSRGVYYEREGKKPEEPGSSPLARGLRSLPGHVRVRFGIIPARAGFTPSFVGSARPARDHPRSRGVYLRRPLTLPLSPGSSPLARGLPSPRSFIPLRSWDHPRSRGVYSARVSTSWTSLGSSPLARGLHPDPRRRPRLRGIIPARAGFTETAATAMVQFKDHPRSRGVYLR